MTLQRCSDISTVFVARRLYTSVLRTLPASSGSSQLDQLQGDDAQSWRPLIKRVDSDLLKQGLVDKMVISQRAITSVADSFIKRFKAGGEALPRFADKFSDGAFWETQMGLLPGVVRRPVSTSSSLIHR